MKHLVLSPIYPPARYGGIEIIAERLCTAMASTDVVQVLSVTPNGATVKRRQFGPVEVWEVPGHFFSHLSADATNAAVIELARPLMRGVDILHCHDWFLADAACTLSNRGVPLIGYFHTVKAMERSRLGEAGTASRRYSECKQAELARRSAVVAVYSSFMRASVSETLNVPSESIVEFMCGPTLPLAQRPGPEPRTHDGFRVTYVGRLAVEKGVDLLLSAFLALSKSDAMPTLQILGSGPLAQDLMDSAAATPVSAGVAFEPFTTDPVELMRAYAASDLIVVPSRFEPYGLVAAEALTLGTPVAVAATGGLPEIVRWGEYGDVFRSDGVDELICVLEAVRADRDGSLKRAARAREVHSDPNLWHDAVRRVLGAVPGHAIASVG